MLKIHNFEVPFFDLDAYRRVWRNLPGYPGFRVSNWGRIKRVDNKKFLTQSINRGYKTVFINGSTVFVHRLVALAFVPNPDNKPYINHKNGVRDWNMACNLEWCTKSENLIHAINVLGYVNNMGIRKTRVSKDGIVVFEGRSVQETARFLGCKSVQVSRVCNKSRNH